MSSVGAVVYSFVQGPRLCAVGVYLALRNSQVRTMKSVAVKASILSVSLYTGGHACLLPLYGIRYFFGTGDATSTFLKSWMHYLVQAATMVAATTLLSEPMQATFFQTLWKVDPKLAGRLESRASQSYMLGNLMVTIQNAMRAFSFTPIRLMLQATPMPGIFRTPATLYLQAHAMAKWVPMKFAAPLVLATMYCAESHGVRSHTRDSIETITHLFLTSLLVFSELLTPFWARSNLGPKRQQSILYRNVGLAFGFSLPFAYLNTLPLVGTVCWPLASAAIAAVVPELDLSEEEARLCHAAGSAREEAAAARLTEAYFALQGGSGEGKDGEGGKEKVK